jgi:hypothetical protein
LRLRSHLVTLVLAAVAPVLIFAAIIVWQDLVERREILDRGMRIPPPRYRSASTVK